MKIFTGILQALLIFAFGMAGFSKVAQPYAQLAQQMEWVNLYPFLIVKLIGLYEVICAVVLLIPWIMRKYYKAMALAGFALVIDMLLAMVTHLIVGDFLPAMGPLNIVLALMAFTVAKRHRGAASAS